MDTDSSFPDALRYGNGSTRRHVAQQGGDNLQPGNCVLLPFQDGYHLVAKHVVTLAVCCREMAS
jgi:hypothetical protein